MKIFDTRHKVSLASNAQVAQVFQATILVLHSHHPLCSVLGHDRGCDFTKALPILIVRAIVFQSIPICNHFDTRNYV